jgi:hypothetical protein
MQGQERWSTKITMREAYLAMREFALTFYRVGGEREKEVEFFANFIAGDPATDFIDPALEDDWFDAVEKVLIDDANQGRTG